MSLLSRPVEGDIGQSGEPDAERVALKDDRLVYRACSMAFALALGRQSPDEVIGRTDFDLLPASVAREQMALDSRVVFTRQSDIGTIELSVAGAPLTAMIVRSPVLAPDGSTRGVDLRLLGGPVGSAMRSAVTVDYETLVNEGLQGSLIFSGRKILFANERAARLLGFDSAQRLSDHGQTGDVFDEAEQSRLADAATRSLGVVSAELSSGTDREPGPLMLVARTRDGGSVHLAGRVTPVQWGARRATLLSFVDARWVGGDGAALATPIQSGAMPVGGQANNQAGVQGHDALVERTRQLEAMASRYRQYARSAADFFWELDDELAFRRVSPDLERVLGVPADHLNGRTHRQLAEHPSNENEAEIWQAHFERLAAREPFRDVEFLWSVGGDTRVIRYSGVPVFGPDRQFAGYRGVGCDVTAATRQAQATAYHANHDALTGLANRRHFEAQVGEALESASRDRLTHALCYMDLDNFKPVNDTCGHQAGDELLRQLGQLFDDLVRKSDVLARLGGDEFGVFLYNCEVAEALKLANQIRHEVENFQFLWEGAAFQVGVSIGLVVVDDRWENLDSLFSAADAACYIAKNEGRNRVSVYREGGGNASNRKVATRWVEEIGSALAGDRIHVAAQKIESLQREPDGQRYELLMRMERDDGSLVSPSSFMPSAERYGLSAALDQRMLELTLAWLEADAAVLNDLRHVSLNLSSVSFTDTAFADRLIELVAASPVPAGKLCFEMSETATIANLAKASAFMQRVAQIGCRFCIDDFGSGLSSFAWLRKLPVDFLKIDGMLIKDILDDATDLTTVRAISDISKSMGKRTVAEYIESPRLLNVVRDLGIDFAQGYHVGKPSLVSRPPRPVDVLATA